MLDLLNIYRGKFPWHTNGLDCDIGGNEFKLQSQHYVHFRKIPLGKAWIHLFSQPGFNPSSSPTKDSKNSCTQYYKVRIKGKVEQSRERSTAFSQHIGVVAIEKEAFGSPSTKGRQLYLIYFMGWIVPLLFFWKDSFGTK